ncbi:MAG: GNAT family N-acetyltransferase [Candidatus Levyibacteriota bacterium]
MKINISTEATNWSKFEEKEWSVLDKEHYGRTFDWTKKQFKITISDDNNVVGSLVMGIVVGVAHIENIIVTKLYRRKGIGKMLIQKGEELAKENNAHKIYLETGKTWNLIAFYEPLGYKITADLPNHYAHVDFVQMTKFLS